MIRLILAEDQAMLLDAFEALLGLEEDIQIVGRAPDGQRALQLAADLRPDVIITDIEMPNMTGIELAEKIREQGLPSRVMIVTTFGRAGYLRRALQAGVRGYMLKDDDYATRRCYSESRFRWPRHCVRSGRVCLGCPARPVVRP